MTISRLSTAFGLLAALFVGACTVKPASDGEHEIATESQPIQKADQRKLYVHMMPWFQVGGLHWNSIGRFYNPQIGPYNSGDYSVIEYQFLLMKYTGIDGVIIDWPGLSTMFRDLPTNAANTEKIINETAKFGLEFAVCFEDQYASSVSNAVTSMNHVRDHYFNRPNHIVIGGGPALFVFGPQRLAAADWPTVLAGTGTDPMFFTLWYNTNAGSSRDGTFAWIYSDALTGVANYYRRTDQGLKVPVLYPGFHSAAGTSWTVGYDLNGDTMTALWNLALNAGNALQIATWNDYSEGTMIEPTNEFGYRFLTTLQKLVGAVYGEEELRIVRLLYDRRLAGDSNAEAASQALIKLDVARACALLGCTAPIRPITGGTLDSGTSGAGGTLDSGASGAGGARVNSGTSGAGGTLDSGTSGGNTTDRGTTGAGGTLGSGTSDADTTGSGTSGGGGGAGGSSSGVVDRVGTSSDGCSVGRAGSRSEKLVPLWLAVGLLAAARRGKRSCEDGVKPLT